MPTKLSTVSVARTPLLEEYNSWYSPTGLCVPTVAQCAVSPAARAISAENSPNNNTGVFISCKMTGKIRATCAHSERGIGLVASCQRAPSVTLHCYAQPDAAAHGLPA